jgi:hypothetical protein
VLKCSNGIASQEFVILEKVEVLSLFILEGKYRISKIILKRWGFVILYRHFYFLNFNEGPACRKEEENQIVSQAESREFGCLPAHQGNEAIYQGGDM